MYCAAIVESIIFAPMKAHIVLFLLAFSFFSCKNEGQKTDTIRSESELLEVLHAWSNTDSLNNPEVLKKYTQAIDEFTENYPNSAEHENFLFLGARNAVNLRDFNSAAAKFARYSELYPDKRSHADALFAAGFLYHNELHNLDSARKYYEIFLLTYPEHMYTDQVESELTHLGKTPEEMLRDLTKGQDSLGKE